MNTNIVEELFKKPKKDKGENATHFHTYLPNQVHQADLLFLPDDDGFKYALVVVDIGTRKTDAEPIKDKSNDTVLKAFQKIYKRSVLKLPKQLEVDSGTEFKGTVKQYFESQGVKVRVGKPHRHRQLGMVERRNQIIGRALFKRMIEEELLTGHPSNQWTDELKKVLKDMNVKPSKMKIPKATDVYPCTNNEGTILDEGTKVRVALEAPIDVVSGKRLHGKFRDQDIKWEVKPREIKQVIIEPGKPIMYLVSNDDNGIDHRQAYTKNQLLPVSATEQGPRSSAIQPRKQKGKKTYIVDKLMDRKKLKNRIVFLVRWKGFNSDHDTWEPRAQLIKDVPDEVKQFETDLKK